MTAVGGVGGGLIGRFVGEDDARFYAGEIRSGRTVVTVQSDGRYEEAQAVLHSLGGYDRESRATAALASPAGAAK